MIESDLFGHVKGAFTGAARDRPGRFQVANHGTLLLDEIAELPLALQAKLLRVLQEGTFEPVGSDRTIKVDVRVLAATHADLYASVQAGRFREDLYYRLAVFPLSLPALRDRLEDLEGLCAALLHEQARRTGKTGFRVSDALLKKLARYGFPGNLRELSNVLERATILAGASDVLGPEHIDLGDTHTRARSEPPERAEDTLVTLAEMEARYIRRVLESTRGRVYGAGGAAEVLGIPPSTLQSRMKKLGVARVG
jgi:transcriptional regulator with GAF, ATPase, and Fis domain